MKAMRLFQREEKLEPGEEWFCPECKQHREATKQISVWRLPPYLVIHLKRFSFKNLLWREKLDFFVEYPVKGLDLTEFCPTAQTDSCLYDLFAVANHHGAIWGGHYTAYACSPG